MQYGCMVLCSLLGVELHWKRLRTTHYAHRVMDTWVSGLSEVIKKIITNCIVWMNYFAVYESFRDYIATETMDGENKYDAGEHSLQVRMWRIINLVIRSICHSIWQRKYRDVLHNTLKEVSKLVDVIMGDLRCWLQQTQWSCLTVLRLLANHWWELKKDCPNVSHSIGDLEDILVLSYFDICASHPSSMLGFFQRLV